LRWSCRDCGSLVVVDDDARVVGMITDRDACMAAYTQGKPLGALPVSSAMSRRVESCPPKDTILEATHIMQAAQVRRLPVVAEGNLMVGVLTRAPI